MITLELLNENNEKELLKLDRGDIPNKYVEPVEYIIDLSRYGLEHGLAGFCTAIKKEDNYIGIILIGEAILGEKELEILKNPNPFRVMGFLIDKKFQSQGIGKLAFQMILDKFYLEYGKRPLILECYRENSRAKKFYENFGFKDTGFLMNNDIVMLKDV